MHSAQSFAGFTTTAMAAAAAGSSTTEMPLSAQAANASGLITRLAPATSTSPLHNLPRPPPVPENATETFTSGLRIENSSAMAREMGYTVEEPSTRRSLGAAQAAT